MIDGGFTKDMARDVIEDQFAHCDSPFNRGIAVGLAGAFRMTGMLDDDEYKAYQDRIQSLIVGGKT